MPDSAHGRIEVRPMLELAEGNDVTVQPATAFTRAGDRFQPATQDETVQRNRYLRLDVLDHYRVLDLDVDGSALKVADFAYSLERCCGRRRRTRTNAAGRSSITPSATARTSRACPRCARPI